MATKLALNESEGFKEILQSVNQIRTKLGDNERLSAEDVKMLRKVDLFISGNMGNLGQKDVRDLRNSLYKLNGQIMDIDSQGDKELANNQLNASMAVKSALDKVSATDVTPQTKTISAAVPIMVKGRLNFIDMPGGEAVQVLRHVPQRDISILSERSEWANFGNYSDTDPNKFARNVVNAYFLQSLKERGEKLSKNEEAELTKLGNSIADDLKDRATALRSQLTYDLRNSGGVTWEQVEAKLRQGDVKGAFGLLPETSKLKSDIGAALDKSLIWDIKKGSATINYFEAGPVELYFSGSMEKIDEWLGEGTGQKILKPVVYALGVYYKQAWANYMQEARSVTTGDITDTREQNKVISQRLGAKVSAAFGFSRKMSILIDAYLDNERQEIIFVPYVRKLEEGAGGGETGLKWHPTKLPALGLGIEGIKVGTEAGSKLLRDVSKQEGATYISRDDISLSVVLKADVKLLKEKLQIEALALPLGRIVDGELEGGIEGRLGFRAGNPRKVSFYLIGKGGLDTLAKYVGAEAGINVKQFIDLGADFVKFGEGANAQHALGLQLRLRY